MKYQISEICATYAEKEDTTDIRQKLPNPYSK